MPQQPSSCFSATRGGFQVLIVDDSLDTLDIMRRLLTRAGYQVAIASNANAALATARQQPPDIIVSDIGMPECDGFQLLRLLQAELAPRKVPAIAVSGFSGENDRLAARESGFDAYFTKPLDVTALINAVDRLLAAGAPRESAAPHRQAAELTSAK